MIKKTYLHQKDDNLKKLSFILVFILVFISNDSMSMKFLGENELIVQQIIYLATIFIFIIKNKSLKCYTKNIIYIYVLFVITLTTMLFNFDFTYGYIVQMITFTFGYIVVCNLSFRLFCQMYTRVIYYLALLSILLFFLFLFMPHLLSFFPSNSNPNNKMYVNMFFYIQYIGMIRNTGIFREPGVYIIYLNIAYLIELFFFNKPRKKYLIVYLIAILTTLSTAGFIILGLIALIYIINNKSIKITLITLLIGVFVTVFIVLNFSVFETTISKITLGEASNSTLARISSIWVPYEMFINKPYLGVGMSKFLVLYEKYSLKIYGIVIDPLGNTTNTFMNFLAIYGVLFMGLLSLGYYKLTAFFSKSIIIRFLIFISFILMFSNEDLRFSVFFSTLFFYGISCKNINSISCY